MASLCWSDRDLKRGEAAAKEVGPNAIALQLDVTDHASITAAAERIRKELGRLYVPEGGRPYTKDKRKFSVASNRRSNIG
jgi:NAD(P)-dependent dehydrogenase (short-subunit alcohol dehydrogenase family)